MSDNKVINPAVPGIYEVKFHDKLQSTVHYSKFSNGKWHLTHDTIERAAAETQQSADMYRRPRDLRIVQTFITDAQAQVAFITDAQAKAQARGDITLGDYIGRVLAVDPHPNAPTVERRILPDDGTREDFPMYDGLLAYFPAALAEVARWSVVGNRKHNPGQKLHWAREKSTDHENKIVRHLLDARAVDKDGFVEAVALAWRALALCQTILEERGWAEGANARKKVAQ